MDPKINNIIDIKKNVEKVKSRRNLESLINQLEKPNPELQKVFLLALDEYMKCDPEGYKEILDKYSMLVLEWENKGYI